MPHCNEFEFLESDDERELLADPFAAEAFELAKRKDDDDGG